MNKLRELRNKIIHNGEPPLERGAEVMNPFGDGKTPLQFFAKNSKTKWILTHKDSKVLTHWDITEHPSHSEQKEWKNLGKPVSWGEVLRMLETKSDGFALSTSGLVFHYEEELFILDLTKEPEDQEPEVLEELIKLINV
jgi:hypothetical protein